MNELSEGAARLSCAVLATACFTVVTVITPFGRTEVRLGYGRTSARLLPHPYDKFFLAWAGNATVLLPIAYLVMMGRLQGGLCCPLTAALCPCTLPTESCSLE